MTARLRLALYVALVVVTALVMGCTRPPATSDGRAHAAHALAYGVSLAEIAQASRIAPAAKIHASGHVTRNVLCDDDDEDDETVSPEDGLPGRDSDDDDTDDVDSECDPGHRLARALDAPAFDGADVNGERDPTIRPAGAHARPTEHPPRS